MIKTELLGVADAVAREKGIDREEIISAMEIAIQKASRARYGHDRDVRTKIDRKTGEISLEAFREVVEDVENEASQITIEEAQRLKPGIQLGEFIVDPLPPFDYGRVAAQTAKQVIFQRVREVERANQYEEFKDRIGQIINGVIKRVEFGNVIVDLGRAEGVILRDQLIPREPVRVGERIRAYIQDVRQEMRGSQIFLSRTAPEFMAKLFAQEVPEVYDGQIEIKSVARDPGSRAKMAVWSGDKSIDPVGACVGMRGSRVQAVVNELQGEKVDLIPWSDNPAVFIVNAMIPAEVSKVVLDEDTTKVDVIVPDEQLSLAIGRRGQNVRLASQLTGWSLDVRSESEDSERRAAEVKSLSELFIEALDVDDVIAHLLIGEGFRKVEELFMVSVEELAAIEGFELEIAEELQNRARAFVQARDERYKKQLLEAGVTQELLAFSMLNMTQKLELSKKGIKTLDDLADLAGDELREILTKLTLEQANEVIMAAREHWFGEDVVLNSSNEEEKEPAPQQ